MATARLELPDGGASWAGRQAALARLERLGYRVDLVGVGGRWQLLIRADDPA